MVKLVKRNVLVESKGFAFLKDVSTQPPCRMISHPKFQHEVTSPIYRTCSLNSRKCGVPCWCHSQQTSNSVFRVLSIPYTLALKAASIAVILDHHAHPYLDTISDICGKVH